MQICTYEQMQAKTSKYASNMQIMLRIGCLAWWIAIALRPWTMMQHAGDRGLAIALRLWTMMRHAGDRGMAIHLRPWIMMRHAGDRGMAIALHPWTMMRHAGDRARGQCCGMLRIGRLAWWIAIALRPWTMMRHAGDRGMAIPLRPWTMMGIAPVDNAAACCELAASLPMRWGSQSAIKWPNAAAYLGDGVRAKHEYSFQ
ncbi:hypothetical protein GDO78_018222 [Eleutherodactylus coqui]|uniref:Uncharacterized protein n=1 Tax=Eleutherodactylus coqui TaxID=57060 RepID=A0A8J6B965_ELECQ|nr:hypothetical protein GDO78_018222 [Eleutherodactylus coqui]